MLCQHGACSSDAIMLARWPRRCHVHIHCCWFVFRCHHVRITREHVLPLGLLASVYMRLDLQSVVQFENKNQMHWCEQEDVQQTARLVLLPHAHQPRRHNRRRPAVLLGAHRVCVPSHAVPRLRRPILRS